jgi:hypothetical protein
LWQEHSRRWPAGTDSPARIRRKPPSEKDLT